MYGVRIEYCEQTRMLMLYMCPQSKFINFHDSTAVDSFESTIRVLLVSPSVDVQLDESKAYEEMVETLTAKNLELGERCGELEATVADLESSVQLSEELEVQQAEDMRELQVSTSK